MYTLTVENSKGEQLQLTNNNNYAISEIDGLNPSPANINTSSLATNDGTIYNSSFVNQRNIVITIYILRSVEKNRIALYKFFRPKEFVKLYFSNGSRNVFIEGYVESFEGSLFSMSQNFQISIICTFPFFQAQRESVTISSGVTAAFKFPFAIPEKGIAFSETSSVKQVAIINNDGDVAAGMTIELSTEDTVSGIVIRNLNTQESFSLSCSLSKGDVIRIITQNGKKSATLITYGVSRNLIKYVSKGSKWLQVEPGTNNFVIDYSSGKNTLTATFYHTDLFEGV